MCPFPLKISVLIHIFYVLQLKYYMNCISILIQKTPNYGCMNNLSCLFYSSLSGLFCENPPPMILLQTSPCDQSDCQNGAQCLVVVGEPICRCIPGFYGNKCDKVSTVHFLGRDGYVALPGTKLRPTAHISLQVGSTFDL